MLAVLTVNQLFDSVKIRVDGPRSWHEHVVIDWVLTDADERLRVELRNGVLVHREVAPTADGAQLELTLTTGALRRLLTGSAAPEALVGAGDSPSAATRPAGAADVVPRRARPRFRDRPALTLQPAKTGPLREVRAGYGPEPAKCS